MSDRPVRVAGGMGRMVGVPATNLNFGMINPRDLMQGADGALTPVAFRFLANMYHELSQQRADIDAILGRLANAGIP